VKLLSGPSRDWSRPASGTAVTVGVFDGVHRGHQALIDRLHAEAGSRQTAVVTFDQHPASVVAPGAGPGLLTPPEHRLQLLDDLGIDIVAHLEFNAETSRLLPESFVAEVLVGALNAQVIVAGTDFRFGMRGVGDVTLLRRLEAELDFATHLVDPLMDGDAVSSTRIRERIASGDLETAARLLGRHFSIRGRVVEGEGRGRSIGVPTANIEHHSDQVLPLQGVYAVVARFNAVEQPGVANVGVRPTFGETRMIVEVHLIDFDGDLYDVDIDLEFRHRIRSERKFDGVEQLVAQIQSDIAEGAALLGVERAG